MADAQAAPSTGDSIPRGTVARAVAIGAVTLLAAMGSLALAGMFSPSQRLDAEFRLSSAVLSTILAFTLAVLSTHRANQQRDPILALLPPGDPARHDWGRTVTPAQRLAVIAAGSLFGIVIIPLFQGDPGLYLHRESWDALLLWSVVLNMLLFSALGVLALHGLKDDAYLEEHVVPRIPIDLLDPAPLSVFGRRGVVTAGFWLIGSSLASLLFMSFPFSLTHAAIVTCTLALGVAALLRPIRGIHGRIQAAKMDELARIRAGLRIERAALLEAGEPGRLAAARIPGLVAWEQRIADVSSWPIDLSATVRVGVLGGLAIGSWVGGAVIERFVEAVLG